MGGGGKRELMGVPKSRRKESKFEAQHHYYKLRTDVTNLILLDFGFSEEKYKKGIERYRQMHENAPDVEAVVARYEQKCRSFKEWFVDKEADAVLHMLRMIETEFTIANSIYPSETPAKIAEFCERRKHMDEAISWCYVLKQELQYIIRTLPVNINKFERFAKSIDEQISLYKGVRTSDNRLWRTKPGKSKKQANKAKP